MKIILLGLKRLFWFTPLLTLGLLHKKDKGFYTGWETGDFRQDYFIKDAGLCNPPNDTLVDQTRAHSGSKSARFICRYDYKDCQGSPRTDLKFPDNLNYAWFDFWIYLDSSYTISDPIPELFFQTHHRSTAVGPPPMGIWINNGRYQVQLLYFPGGYDSAGVKVSADLGAVAPDANKWVHWTFHVNFALDDSGLWEVWRNGKKLYYRSGPNYNKGETSWYAKIGIYKWRWKKSDKPLAVEQRVWWLDDLKVGTKDNTIEDFIDVSNADPTN